MHPGKPSAAYSPSLLEISSAFGLRSQSSLNASTTARENRFKHSKDVDSERRTYSAVPSAAIPRDSCRMAAVIFWSDVAQGVPRASLDSLKYPSTCRTPARTISYTSRGTRYRRSKFRLCENGLRVCVAAKVVTVNCPAPTSKVTIKCPVAIPRLADARYAAAPVSAT
jgi:hypothetical protein